MRSRKRATVLAAAALLVGTTLITQNASATLTGAVFQGGDGNIVVDAAQPGTVDWDNLVASGGTLSIGQDQQSGQNDNSYTQGSKENDVDIQIGLGSIPNNKADIGQFAVGSQVIQSGARAGNFQMYLAWIRNNDGGTTNFDFEINQAAQPDMTVAPGSPNRSVHLVRTGDGAGPGVDDLLINYDLQGGASTPTLTIQRWQGTQWGQVQTLTSVSSEGKINCVTTGATGSCPNGAGAISAGNSGPFNQAIAATRFGEAAIDLTAVGIIPNQNTSTDCIAFGSAYVKSRSSSAFTSQMKDYVAPIELNLDTCGSIKIIKATDPSPDPTATSFGYTRSGPGTNFDAPFSLVDGGFDKVSGLPPGSYSVTEADPGPNFVLSDLECNDANGTVDVNTRTASITLDANEDVVCTYTNTLQRGNIIVRKVAERDGTSFPFTASYDADGFSLANGQQDDSGPLLPGPYSVAETPVPAGWNLASSSCDDGSNPATIGLDPDETVTCTFNNVIERGAVAVHKTAKDAAHGGSKPLAGVPFVVTNTTNGTNTTITTDASGNACVDNLPVSVLDGDYTIDETVPAGYADVPNQTYTVVEGTCASVFAAQAEAQFVNIPLTTIDVHVDSLVDGGTKSTVSCVDSATPPNTVAGGVTAANGDGVFPSGNLQP
jgi:hypothetical protein